MAINKSPISEKMKGKISNMIFYEVNGQMRVRTSPLQIRDRKSKAQLRSRERFAFLMRLAKQFRYIIPKGFRQQDIGCSARNMFTKINALSLVENESTWTIDPLSLVCSQGLLANVAIDAYYDCHQGVLRLTIEEEVISPTQNSDDEVILALWHPMVETYSKRIILPRKQGDVELAIDIDPSVEWFLYFFVTNDRLCQSSTSRSIRLRFDLLNKGVSK